MPGTSPSDERTCDTTTLLRHSLPLSLPPDWSLPLFILLFLRDRHPRLFRAPPCPTPSPFSSFSYFYFAYFHLEPLPVTALSNFSRMFLIMPELVPLWRTLANTFPNRMSRVKTRINEIRFKRLRRTSKKTLGTVRKMACLFKRCRKIALRTEQRLLLVSLVSF